MAENRGMVHLYWGEGKGKTTAAVGLALRALGSGLAVVMVQFLKSGNSGELEPLRRLGAAVFSGSGPVRFLRDMDENQRQETRMRHDRMLSQALRLPCDVLILDEACAAWEHGMVDESLLRRAVERSEKGCEVVLTGRRPAQWMLERGDYITEMRLHAHPYTGGTAARKGIEF